MPRRRRGAGHSAAVGAHLSRTTARSTPSRPTAVGHRAGQRQALLAGHLARGRRSRPTSGRPGATWSRRTARAGRATSPTPTSRSISPDRPVKAAASDEILVIATQTPLAAAEATAVAHATGRRSGSPRATPRPADAARGRARRRPSARRARTQLIAGYVPVNLADPPAPPATQAASPSTTAFVVFPPDPPTKPAAWTQAPQVAAVPGALRGPRLQRAVSRCSRPSAARSRCRSMSAPTRRADPDDGDPPGGRRPVRPRPAELAGRLRRRRRRRHGHRHRHLDGRQAAAGFDRLLVLGVQPRRQRSATAAAALDELLPHHRVGRSGLSLIPQGTPAHNTAGATSGYTPARRRRRRASTTAGATPLFIGHHRPGRRRRRAVARRRPWASTRPAAGRARRAAAMDQARARAMQRALWPATLGYWMDKLLAPVFGDETVADCGPSSPATSAAAARCRRSGSAHRPTACCRPRRSPASAGSTSRREVRAASGSWPVCCACCAWYRPTGRLSRRASRGSAAAGTRTRSCWTSSACTRPRSSTTGATRRA